ncbi:hypothetical protein BU17DRAFT_68110 [Hysterangium stoloniferum]|nr:hypothetical protein BU17DRAFT_68110 [Hysterangium stoloniferum]
MTETQIKNSRANTMTAGWESNYFSSLRGKSPPLLTLSPSMDWTDTVKRHEQLTTANVGYERPIIFVAHSLGGIVLKYALLHSRTTHETHLFSHRQLHTSTYGIIFLGTPHQGTTFADMASKLLTFSVVSLFMNPNMKILKHLLANSETLQDQISEYTSISSDFVTKFCYELYQMRFCGLHALIVPKETAVVPGAVNAEPLGIHADHVEMTKFPSNDVDDFIQISQWLEGMVAEAPPKIESNWAVFRPTLTPLDSGSL